MWCSMLKRNIMQRLFFHLLLVPLILGLSGCKVVQTIDSFNGILDAPPADPEIGTLLNAEFAFFSGNYDLAEDLYYSIRIDSNKDDYKNHALYGLACIRIITAEDTEQLKLGFNMLTQWQEPGVEAVGYQENPKMITKALNDRVGLLDVECEPEIRYVTTKKKGDLLKKHKDEIVELKSTIKKLEHQISVLEAIDQEVQEKRKPL